jgi:hypothetical protein
MTVSDHVQAVPRLSPLVAPVYTNVRCRQQAGGEKLVDDTVVDLGKPGPVIRFYAASAFSPAGDRPLLAQPAINGRHQGSLDSAVYANPAVTHKTLLRRRAYADGLHRGQSRFSVVAGPSTVSDPLDRITMSVLDISDVAGTPTVAASMYGPPADRGLYGRFSVNVGDNPLLISVSATGWARTEGQMLGAQLDINGTPDAEFQIFANPANNHMQLVGGDRVRRLPKGQHTLALRPQAGTMIDGNDLFAITLTEFPPPSRIAHLLNNRQCATQQGKGVIASVDYESNGGTHLICLWVSGYSHKGNQELSAQVVVDENPVGRVFMFANPAETHMLLGGGDIAAGAIPKGKRRITVLAGPDTITDFNDRISLSVIEVYRG